MHDDLPTSLAELSVTAGHRYLGRKCLSKPHVIGSFRLHIAEAKSVPALPLDLRRGVASQALSVFISACILLRFCRQAR